MESTVQKALNDAEAIILAAPPLFVKRKGWRVVRAKGEYLGTATSNAEHEALLRAAQSAERTRTLWPGQSATLGEFADFVFPGLKRSYAKAHETLIQRIRSNGIRVDELEKIQEWNRRKLNRMNEKDKATCREIRQRVAAERNGQ